MRPLTNAEIQARKTPAQLAAERGTAEEVQSMAYYQGGYQLCWQGADAHVTRDSQIVYSGTKPECEHWLNARGCAPCGAGNYPLQSNPQTRLI